VSETPTPARARRTDAERNREKLVAVARDAFAAPGTDVSMTEIARRADVGVGTLYRHFRNRRELLEAVFADDVDAVCAEAAAHAGSAPGDALAAWLRRFFAFYRSKRHVGAELMAQAHDGSPLVTSSRPRVISAGRPLFDAAQRAGDVRADLGLEQVLDLVIATARIEGDQEYLAPILQVVIDGLRPPAGGAGDGDGAGT
jgi:AcrR family transcriptional regulator